jgi:cyclic pyranopterin phosphate synthase
VVPLRGVNDDEMGALLDLAREHDARLRFIELMPLEVARELYDARHLGGEALLALLAEHGTWIRRDRRLSDGPARLYRREADGMEVGIIDPLSPNFCAGCNRVRITHRGELRNCLFGRENLPLRPLLAQPDADSVLERTLRRAVFDKPERHRLEDFDDGQLYSLVRVGG